MVKARMGFAGNQIKVRFFSMTNVDGLIYAKFDVLSPKKVLSEDRIVDLEKLGEYSKSLKNGIFVGVEQTKRDSLYTAKNTTREWNKGHFGYFNIFDTLFVDDGDKIREILGVDGFWDGEWNKEDILTGLTEKQIQFKIDEYKNDPWIKNFPKMNKIWTGLKDTELFIQKCKKLEIPEKTYSYYIKSKKDSFCTDCKKENCTSKTWLTNPKDLNKKRNVCFDCGTKYKPLFIHGMDKKTGQLTMGALVSVSDILRTELGEGKPINKQIIHVCANLEKVNNEYIWVIKKEKQIIDFAQKYAKLGVIGKEVYEIRTENKKRKVTKYSIE